jgi:Fe(II)/alpha-ketoglutarate-dependent arginine beta-hydroxylase
MSSRGDDARPPGRAAAPSCRSAARRRAEEVRTMASQPTRELCPESAHALVTTAEELAVEYGTVSHPELVRLAPEYAGALDDELRHQLRPPEPEHGLAILRGLPVDDVAIGPTPPHWSSAVTASTTVHDIAMLLMASVAGRAFGWEGQQDGRLVHNILPSRGHETEQTGASSAVLLSPHTEDAFHPERAHLMLLGCLRNHDGVGTSAASVRDTELSDADLALLSEPRLPILPDDAYADAQAFGGEAPEVAVLWEGAHGPGLRYDPAYTPLDRADPSYRAAYGRLSGELERVATSVRLGPGDVLVIDNDVVVHGREPFRARYDGTDRWLKRVSVHVPGRVRPAAETAEHGYGQRILDPYR